MRRARPYRGENPEPGNDVHGELDPTPGIRELPGSISTDRRRPHNDSFSSNTGSNAAFDEPTRRAKSGKR